MSYDHNRIDKKWQSAWESAEAFKAVDFSEKPKFYALDMFPYPSGKGLHVGHMASYTPTDVVSRYKRQKGFNVLHPIGYDAFGLPAEQYAIQTGIHPAKTTTEAIANFKRQLKSFGFSFDWSREISTCEPSFYKWTQFIFGELFKKGLAYQKEVPVNWCPALKTVLANEEVVDGKSERGGHPVIRKPMKQWMLKITTYAERLIEDLDKIQWPNRTKEGQKNWIGQSRGAQVQFRISNSKESFDVFTTRPDTLYGVTFMVLAPEHPLVSSVTSAQQKNDVEQYIKNASLKSEMDRKSSKEKSGVFTGGYAIHPLTEVPIPLWVADYVLMDYGTGAIMAVPGHDERDFEFAQTYNIPILRVLESESELPFIGDGRMVNSRDLDGLNKNDAIEKTILTLEKKNLGQGCIEYKLRDWLFSRQRYWGEPFPIVHSEDALKLVPCEDLPVELPPVANYEPSDDGSPPLARNSEWVQYNKGDLQGERNTDTMPGTAGSSWYFLRFIDPHNDNALADMEKQKYWMPVDLYVGGPEHTVSHLLYCRFWQKFLYDQGFAAHPEPMIQLAHQGMILGTDGEKMSKSRGNTINPDDVRLKYGADALRCFILFLGPMERDKPWNSSGITGVRKFLDRAWRLCIDDQGQFRGTQNAEDTPSEGLNRTLHKTIQKVGDDIESLNFNTAISALMILVNEIYKENCFNAQLLQSMVSCLAPFAPHMCEEIWELMEQKGFASLSPWPTVDKAYLSVDAISLAVQVNGKKRGLIETTPTASEDEVLPLAKALEPVTNAIGDKKIVKIIYIPGRILNLIAK